MAIALAIFGVVFSAFCVWLTVRIVNRRERWAKWTLAGALIVACPIAFVAKRAQAARQARQQAEQAYEQLRKARMNPTLD
jgi:multisubunit Na+/H+ antiporter MnhE subunit